MSKPLTEDQRARLRQRALQKHNSEMQLRQATGKGGWSGRFIQWERARIEATRENHPILGRAATAFNWAIARPFKWLIVKPVAWAGPGMFTYKETDGHRHFAPKRSAISIAVLALIITFRSYIAMGAYYYGTLRTYNDVYVPNAGVFVNQQFEHPNVPGRTANPRDEIHTVLGKRLDEAGRLESFRGDIDSHAGYFFWKKAAWRPDLLAAEITPQSPYGAICSFEVTGSYTVLPRPLRFIAKNWLGTRPEIVDGSCRQLKEVPLQYVQVDAPEVGQKALPPPPH